MKKDLLRTQHIRYGTPFGSIDIRVLVRITKSRFPATKYLLAQNIQLASNDKFRLGNYSNLGQVHRFGNDVGKIAEAVDVPLHLAAWSATTWCFVL
jgi:hypothetical protein